MKNIFKYAVSLLSILSLGYYLYIEHTNVNTIEIIRDKEPTQLVATDSVTGELKEVMSDAIIVGLDKCVDGDTAWFNIDGERTKVRFLYVDTPESTNTTEPYGKEASEFTCNLLTNAELLTLEYDGNTTDKYGRTLAWVWVNDLLVQEELAKNGYVEKVYDYGSYKYEERILSSINDMYGIYNEQ